MIDVVTLEVLRNGFQQICEEMTITLLKTTYSVIFNEGKDLSSAVFDADVNLIAQDREGCPVHILGMKDSVTAAIGEYGIENLREGDVIIINDSYRGGTHLPDITLVGPVFWEGKLVGFVGDRGHHTDVGGMVPGSFAGDATEVYQEGLTIPAVKIMDRGELVKDILNMILLNVRLPEFTFGDISAQIAGVKTGVKRYQDLIAKYGWDTIKEALKAIQDYSEKAMRAELASMPDGEYEFVDYMDSDGQVRDAKGNFKPYKIQLKIKKKGTDIEFDFEGTSSQAKGPINSSLTVTRAGVFIGLFESSDPNIHPSEGAFKPVKINVPKGCFLNPVRPAATCSGLTETCNSIADVVRGALASVRANRVAAGELASCNVYTLGGMKVDGTPWVALLNPKGGWGGMYNKDGWDCTQDPLSNCRNQPVESLERSYPFKVTRYEMHTGPEGAGKFRGGWGIIRDFEMHLDTRLATCLGRSSLPPFGLFGGNPGVGNTIYLKRKGEDSFKEIPARASNIELHAGDIVRIKTAIGGGYGDPYLRSPQMVLDDVIADYYTIEDARKVYGVVIDEESMTVDSVKTDELRRNHVIREKSKTPTEIVKELGLTVHD